MNNMIKSGRILKTLFECAERHGLINKLVLRGSLFYGAELVEGWSDVDLSIMVGQTNKPNMMKIKEFVEDFESHKTGIPLSITIIEEDDTFVNNPYHHHGVKPISYNYELARAIDTPYTKHLSSDELRMSSVYRYYEILHSFRRDYIKSTVNPDSVAKGYHRVARFIRTQIEIMFPAMVKEKKKLFERNHYKKLGNDATIEGFFKKYDTARNDWANMRKDKEVLQEEWNYLLRIITELHNEFLPFIKRMGD